MHAEALPAHVTDVTQTARRYGRVLLSRRMWRALAVATLSGAFTLLIAAAVIPVVIMLTAQDATPLGTVSSHWPWSSCSSSWPRCVR